MASRDKPRIVFQDGEYRVVLMGTERYVIEKKDGEDSMGVERWTGVDSCLWWPGRQAEDDQISVPRDVFRGLMEVVCRVVDAEERGKAVGS